MKPVPVSTPALGPLPSFARVRNSTCAKAWAQARLRAGQRRGSDSTPRCAGSAAVLTLGSRCITPSARCARCGRTDAASQMTKRAGTRADPRAPLLAVSYSPRHWPARSLAETVVHLGRISHWCLQGRAWAAAGRACEATRSAGLGARARTRALRDLTRCACSTTTSAASGGSCATGPRDRAPQCSRCTSPTASPKRPAAAQARPCSRGLTTCRMRTLNDSNGPRAEARFMHRGSREARWRN